MSLTNWWSMAYIVFHAHIRMKLYIYYHNNCDVEMMPKCRHRDDIMPKGIVKHLIVVAMVTDQ